MSIIDEESIENMDEITNFQSAQRASQLEAMWRICCFPLNEIEPSVITLQLHLENKQPVTFKRSDNLDSLIKNYFDTKSMLTKYFLMNKINDKAQTLLYKEFLEYFVWNQQDKIWIVRKKRKWHW